MGSGEAAQILVERERREAGVVARLTVDNQAKLNVLDSRLTNALRRAVEGLAGEAELRAVVLTGAGSRAFIGGADIRELAALTPATARIVSPIFTGRRKRRRWLKYITQQSGASFVPSTAEMNPALSIPWAMHSPKRVLAA